MWMRSSPIRIRIFQLSLSVLLAFGLIRALQRVANPAEPIEKTFARMVAAEKEAAHPPLAEDARAWAHADVVLGAGTRIAMAVLAGALLWGAAVTRPEGRALAIFLTGWAGWLPAPCSCPGIPFADLVSAGKIVLVTGGLLRFAALFPRPLTVHDLRSGRRAKRSHAAGRWSRLRAGLARLAGRWRVPARWGGEVLHALGWALLLEVTRTLVQLFIAYPFFVGASWEALQAIDDSVSDWFVLPVAALLFYLRVGREWHPLRPLFQPISPMLADVKARGLLNPTAVWMLAIGIGVLGWLGERYEPLMVGMVVLFIIAWYQGLRLFRIGYALAEELDRRRALWLVQGFFAFAFALILFAFGDDTVHARGLHGLGASRVPMNLSFLFLILGLSIGIFYHGALDPRLVIRRTTLFAGLAVLGTVLFNAMQDLVADTIGGFIGLPQSSTWVAAALVVLILVPLHGPLRRGFDELTTRYLPAIAARDAAQVWQLCVSLPGGHAHEDARLIELLRRAAAKTAGHHGASIIESGPAAIILVFGSELAARAAVSALGTAFEMACDVLAIDAPRLTIETQRVARIQPRPVVDAVASTAG